MDAIRLILSATVLFTGFFQVMAQQSVALNSQETGIPYVEIHNILDFLRAEEQIVTTHYNLGAFTFKEKTLSSFSIKYSEAITSSDGKALRIRGTLWSKNTSKESGFQLIFQVLEDGSCSFELSVDRPSINYLSLTLRSDASEQFFGFGEQFSYIDLKGKKFPVFTEEQGIGRGDAPVSFFTNFVNANGNEFTSYCPIPFTLTTAKRAILILNTEYTVFDLRKDDLFNISVRSDTLKGIIWTGHTPKELLTQYTAYAGRMPMLPEWATGSILGLQGGREKVERIVTETKQSGNPVSAVWIQDWVGKRATKIGSRLYWNWIPDSIHYPDIKDFIAGMNQQGVKVLGYINPFLAEYGPLTEEAIQHNYLVKNMEGRDYLLPVGGFDAYLLDLSNPHAREWIKGVIKENLIGNGFSGWMADFAEWLPFDARLYSGEPPENFHNRYPVIWAQLNREAIQEAGKEGEVAFFNRSGFSFSTCYSTLFWAGDQMVSRQRHDGMPSAFRAMLSSGMSGITLNHSDVGGYTSVKKFPVRYIRDKRLLIDWMDWCAFTPVFRTHEGLLPEENYQFYTDPEIQQVFAYYGRIHYYLKDYFEELEREASDKGIPVIRHPYLVSPVEEQTKGEEKCALIGDELIIVPKLNKREKRVEVYLPSGEWYDLAGKEYYTGRQSVTLSRIPDKPLALVKQGGIYTDLLMGIPID